MKNKINMMVLQRIQVGTYIKLMIIKKGITLA